MKINLPKHTKYIAENGWLIGIFCFAFLGFFAGSTHRILFAVFFLIAFILCLLAAFFLHHAAHVSLKGIAPIKIRVWHLLLVFYVLVILSCTYNLWHISTIQTLLFCVGNITLVVASVAAIFLASFGIGVKAFRLFRFGSFSSLQEFLLSVGIGLGIIGYLIYFSALLKIAYPVTSGLLMFCLIVLSLSDIRKTTVPALFKTVSFDVKNFIYVFIWVLLGILILAGFVSSLANIMSGGWDTFHQYLTFPNEYARHHELVFFKYHPHWGFPQLGEILFLSSLLLGGISAPFVFNFIIFLFSLAAFFAIFKKATLGKHPLFVAIFLSVPAFVHMYFGYLKIELLVLFYMFLIFIAIRPLFKKNGSDRRKYLLLSAILIGIILSFKYTLIPAAGILLLGLSVKRKKPLNSIKDCAIMSAVVLIIMLPWFIKNLTHYRNPFYPLLPGRDFTFSQAQEKCHASFVSSCREDIPLHLGINKSAQLFVTNATTAIASLNRESVPSIQNPGPWFLLLLPLAFLGINGAFFRFVRLFSLAYFVFWIFIFSGQTWYLFPSFAGLLVVVFRAAQQKGVFRRVILFQPLVALWVFFVTIMTVGFQNLGIKIGYIQGAYTIETATEAIAREDESIVKKKAEKTEKDEELERIYENPFNWIEMNAYINNLITDKKEDTIVYGFMEPQGYFIKDSHKHFIPDFFGYLFTCMEKIGNPKDQLRNMGVRYVFYNERYDKFCKKENIAETYNYCTVQDRFRVFVKDNNLKEVYRKGQHVLYEL